MKYPRKMSVLALKRCLVNHTAFQVHCVEVLLKRMFGWNLARKPIVVADIALRKVDFIAFLNSAQSDVCILIDRILFMFQVDLSFPEVQKEPL